MPYVLVIALQVAAVVHLFVTKRGMGWLFLIILAPGIGAIVYFLIEVVLPMGSNPTARRAWRRAQKAIDPNRGLREGSLNYERSQNIESAAKLADELTKAGRHAEAIRICNEARTGIFVDDPKILLALANAQLAALDYAATIATLDHLRAQNPGFRSADGHLVYARAPGAAPQEARSNGARHRVVRGRAQGRASRAEALSHEPARMDRDRPARKAVTSAATGARG